MTHPLRLAVGSHKAGSGKGCAMNVISWENGDTKITDYPDCADTILANLVQKLNDSYCTHHDGPFDERLLCAKCSIVVLDIAHRTVGTGFGVVSSSERLDAWAKLAHKYDVRLPLFVSPFWSYADGETNSHTLIDSSMFAHALWNRMAQWNRSVMKPMPSYSLPNTGAQALSDLYNAQSMAHFVDSLIDQFRHLIGLPREAESLPVTCEVAVEKMLASANQE